MKHFSLLGAVVAFATFANAQVKVQDSKWPLVLLAKPFHVGDEKNKAMSNSKPDGPKFTAKFELPPNIKPGVAAIVYATIEVGGLVPETAKNFTSMKTTRLLINGTEVAILNKLYRGPGGVRDVQKLSIRIPGTALIEGENELEIVAGASAKNRDDFELHRVALGSSPQ